MRILLYGPDTLRSRRQLHKMIEKFKTDRDPQGLNVVRVDAEKEPNQVLQQILSAPFLAERRMVVVENLIGSTHKELMDEIRTRIEEDKLPESNIVIFWESKDSFRSKAAKTLFALLQKEQYSQHFEALAGTQLTQWMNKEISARGGTAARPALQYIVANSTGNMWQIDSLIDQLIAYKGKEQITQSDVALFLAESADDNIFTLVDAIVAKRPKQVYKMITQQYQEGNDAFYIVAMITRQFRILLQMRDVLEREGDQLRSDVLAKRLGLHPFVAKKSLPLVKRYSMAELEEIYQQLLTLDIHTKTGQGKADMLLDFFVGRVTSA